MMRFFKWFYCLSKRLYRKATFIAVILLIPVSVALFSLTAGEKVGFVRIAVVNQDKSGIGASITDDLVDNSSSVNYIEYSEESAAMTDLDKEKVDAVWVLYSDIENRIARFLENPDNNSIAHIYMKENNLGARLPIEKLSAELYPYAASEVYKDFVLNNPDFNLSDLTEHEIYNYYSGKATGGNLFEFSFPEGGTATGENEANYLVLPIRGILSVIVVICGMASAMFYISDEKRGTFSRAKASSRVLISFASQFTAIVNIGIFALASVFILGVAAPAPREIAIFLIFILNASLLCTVLAQLVKNISLFASLATLLTVLQTLLCPIFFNYKIQRIPQLLFPNTYYINSMHSNLYMWYSLLYMAIAAALLGFIYLKRRKV